ncbi:hypothetical protein BJF93_15405 [Xaviernesmea oryzae]|uniref:Uncharacterized protein n=1 Tax=Xaviernesmea oryzae TaxID=464029 RepID=A0A1Q9AY18_9HYPH|nr:hypothetical protein [Xaviernesmea oryzae]OLP60342.1 hypothetical protein BJF93_15405 [Xaviernesmea oryzae]SEK22611.1 hypothetical protein SAMN04487976_101138 [Xaviernesmea oryzae]
MKKKTDAPGKKGRRPSAITIAAGTRALRNYNATSALLPRCGAKAKTTGEACRQVAMSNGRCCYHGGRTPKGAGWHKIQWPEPNDPKAEEKLQSKLRASRKAQQKREQQLSVMSANERARHEAWQRSHQPGSKRARAAARQQRIAAKEIAAVLATPTADNPEVERIQAEINRLEALATARSECDIFE